MPRQRVVLQIPLHQNAQAVNLFPHVRVSGTQIYAYLTPVDPHSFSNIPTTDDRGVRSLNTTARPSGNIRVSLFLVAGRVSTAAILTNRWGRTGSSSRLFQYPNVASAIRFSRQYPACVCPLFRHSPIRVRQTSAF